MTLMQSRLENIMQSKVVNKMKHFKSTEKKGRVEKNKYRSLLQNVSPNTIRCHIVNPSLCAMFGLEIKQIFIFPPPT